MNTSEINGKVADVSYWATRSAIWNATGDVGWIKTWNANWWSTDNATSDFLNDL